MNKPKPNQSKSNLKPLAFVIAFIISAAAVTAIFMINSDNAEAPSNDKITNSTDWKPYRASEHGFTVSFPGFPVAERQDLDVYGIIVPHTTYTKESKDKVFIVAVSSYPKNKIDIMTDPRSALDGSINGSAQNSDSVIVTSDNNIEFLGNPAASATLKNTTEGKRIIMYCLYFLKDNNLYTIMTVGAERDQFDYMVDSFHFN